MAFQQPNHGLLSNLENEYQIIEGKIIFEWLLILLFLTTLSICQKLFYLPNTDRFEYGIWISFLDSFRPQQCHTMRMN